MQSIDMYRYNSHVLDVPLAFIESHSQTSPVTIKTDLYMLKVIKQFS